MHSRLAMELEQRLLLDEERLDQLPTARRTVFVLRWLLELDQRLDRLQSNDVKGCQKRLVEQLVKQIHSAPGPPARELLGRCLAQLFSIGDTFLLFDTVNACNEILKNKDDSPSFLPIKLACITCIGAMYEKLGRLMGRSYEETVTLLLKSLKNAESQLRCEIFNTLRKILAGMSAAAAALHRDVFKAIKHGLSDRVPLVRCNAARCLQEMLNHAPFLYTTDIENVFSLCFRALEGSSYEVRRSVAKVLGHLVATAHQAPNNTNGSKLTRSPPPLDELLALLASGFLRGGLGGFLKTGPTEMIKGTTSVNKEIRVGIAYAYIEVVDRLGCSWLERHLSVYSKHLLDLLSSPKCTAGTHLDAMFSRRCVFFVLRSLCKRLSEKAQLNCVKTLAAMLARYRLDAVGEAPETNGKEATGAADAQQHVLICVLLEIGCIFDELDTCSSSLVHDNSLKLIDTAVQLLVYPVPAVRVAAAWCLRCIAKACPSQLTPLIDRCVEQLEHNRLNQDLIQGHSLGLSALVGAASQTPLGVPHSKGKIVFCIAEELLRSASQHSRLSLPKTQAGWQLIASVMTLGQSVVRGLLPRLLLLWKSSFPRSPKDLDSEKSRGDAFTWQVTLENRAGALAAMAVFLRENKSLASEETIRRMMPAIEWAVLMLNSLGTLFKGLGPLVKASAAGVRLRLYETLLQLPPSSFEGSFTSLLRLLVAEFTLAESTGNIGSTLLSGLCQAEDQILLGGCSLHTDQQFIEDQLQPNSSQGVSALENDLSCLYANLEDGQPIPSQLPLSVSIVDRSCQLFAHSFRLVAAKHRLQMLSHFQECIRHAKLGRQEAIQINVLTTMIGSLKSLAEHKAPIGSDEIQRSCLLLLQPMLSNPNPLVRCAAAHGLGRLCQVLGDGRFVGDLATTCFEKLQSARDMLSRTGHSLALGYLHRFVGSLGSQPNLSSAIQILLALSQDQNSPLVQVWSLHALCLIVDSGGPMFRGYIDVTLRQALKLLTSASYLNSDLHQCAARLLSTLITTLGPELQEDGDSICEARDQLLLASQLMQTHPDELVQVQAIHCLQQLHLFAAAQISLARLVPALCEVLHSEQLLLRTAAIGCLYQLSQREASEVLERAGDWIRKRHPNELWAEHLLPGLLFDRLDKEQQQPRLREQLQNVLAGMLQSLCGSSLSQVISLCREVLTNAEQRSTAAVASDPDADPEDDDEAGFRAETSAQPAANSCPRWSTKVFAAQTLCKVISFCEHSSDSRVHFDLAAARQNLRSSRSSLGDGKAGQDRGDGDHLILHLSELIRMAFMAATSDSDPLRLAGLQLLELVIEKFASVPEPEFAENVVLEQYQAQVGAALRPAFAADTASHVTAMACQVCSAWIGSGVARDLNDLRRVHQLLVSSLQKLRKDSSSRLYNESASTLEKLAILKAWAEVYIVAMRRPEPGNRLGDRSADNLYDEESGQPSDNEYLLQLVRPELRCLSRCWLQALKDYALLTLPVEFDAQLPHDGGAFFTVEIVDIARPLYKKCWPSILHAACLWLCSAGFDGEAAAVDGPEHTNGFRPAERTNGQTNGFSAAEEPAEVEPETNAGESPTHEPLADLNTRQFHLLLGISMEALCNPKSTESLAYIVACLRSLETLLSHEFTQKLLARDRRLCIELGSVLHRLLITRETLDCQQSILSIAHLLCRGQVRRASEVRSRSESDTMSCGEDRNGTEVDVGLRNGNGEDHEELPTSMEVKHGDNAEQCEGSVGDASGELQPGESICYTLAEIALCVLVRQLPELSASLASTPGLTYFVGQSSRKPLEDRPLDEPHARLVGSAVILLSKLPELCSPAASPVILPTALYLLTGVFRHSKRLASAGAGDCLAANGRHRQFVAEPGDCRNSPASRLMLHEREPMLSLFCAFENLAASPLARNPLCEELWLQMLRSCLAKVLDLCKSCDDEPRPDQISVLHLISIFVLKSPRAVLQPANLQFPCINLLKQCIDDPNEIVQLKTFEVLKRLFQHSQLDSVRPFIHALAPRLVQLVNSEIDCSSRANLTKAKFQLVMTGLETLELLIQDAEHKLNLLLLHIPLLMKLLVGDLSQVRSRPFSVLLHNFALQKLIAVGPMYPAEFRQIVGQAPAYKTRLEAAIRQNQQQVDAISSQSDQKQRDQANAHSTIKLKTDFSNFASC